MERFGDKTMEECLQTSLKEYLSGTSTRAMTQVRRNILQMLIFLYGKETADKRVGFTYSEKRDIAVQQKRFIIFSYLFIDALNKDRITEKDIATHNRLWTQHVVHLINSGKEKAAKKYIRILEDSGDTLFNIKKFKRDILKTPDFEFLAENYDHQTEAGGTKVFRFRRPNVVQRMMIKLFG